MTQSDDKSQSDGQRKAGAEDRASGNADLDSLLSEFEEGTKPEPKKTQKRERPDEVTQFVREIMAERQRKQVDTDIGNAVEAVAKSEAFKGVPKNLVRRMLISHAYDNPAFDQAFQKRGEDPAGWQAAVSKASEELSADIQDLPKVDARDDVEAAKATVEGTSSGKSESSDGPAVADLMNMSDAEFRRYKESLDAA